VGLVCWKRKESIGIDSAITNTLIDLNCEVVQFAYDAPLPQDLDIVLAFGPHGSLKKVARQLLACSPRPAFAFWLLEPLPNPALPDWAWNVAGAMHSYVKEALIGTNSDEGWSRLFKVRGLMSKTRRFGHYGEARWLHQSGILSVLAVGSEWNANILRRKGLNPLVAYPGFHPFWSVDAELNRDIPVLWIGWRGTFRRRKILQAVRSELRSRGIEMLMVDCVENPFVNGQERAILFRRSKIVLNLLRKEWDSNGFRIFLAAANQALIISEPMFAHVPFSSGVHLVETPEDRLVEKICYYLDHSDERCRIAEQGYQYITTELTMKKAVTQILEKAVAAC
jgi:hypothetical protein